MSRTFFGTFIGHTACIGGIRRGQSGVSRCDRYVRDGGKDKGGIALTVSLIFKIAAVGILVSVLCQVLKHSGRDEHAFLISLAGLVLVLLWIVPYIYELFETIRRLFAL